MYSQIVGSAATTTAASGCVGTALANVARIPGIELTAIWGEARDPHPHFLDAGWLLTDVAEHKREATAVGEIGIDQRRLWERAGCVRGDLEGLEWRSIRQ